MIVAVLRAYGWGVSSHGGLSTAGLAECAELHSSFGWQDQALFLESFQLVHGIVKKDHH
jgi:L-alanine-DL-glutamate epimerase-like enolase superfamily enzyme